MGRQAPAGVAIIRQVSAALITSLVLTSLPASAAQVARLAGRGISMPLGGIRTSRAVYPVQRGTLSPLLLKPLVRILAMDAPLLPNSLPEGDAGYHWGKAAGEEIRLAAEAPLEQAAPVEAVSPPSGLTLHDWGRVVANRTFIAVARVLRGVNTLLRR